MRRRAPSVMGLWLFPHYHTSIILLWESLWVKTFLGSRHQVAWHGIRTGGMRGVRVQQGMRPASRPPRPGQVTALNTALQVTSHSEEKETLISSTVARPNHLLPLVQKPSPVTSTSSAAPCGSGTVLGTVAFFGSAYRPNTIRSGRAGAEKASVN
jgi:hypothetical protein